MNETYGLSPEQREEAIDFALGGARSGYGGFRRTWDELSPEQRKNAALWWLKHHKPEDAPLPHIGLTGKQADRIALNLAETLNAMLPALVEVEVNKLIETDHRLVDELRAETRAALRELKDVELHRLENKLMTELRVAVATVKANQQPPVAPPPDATKMDSFERRLSRNADHVQRLEDRIRKLEGRA